MPARPPLYALFVFCEAARCSSFKLAAQALCVTPGAVSRQIRTLEDHLGLPLFERGPQAVRITRKGRQLYERVAPKLAAIQSEAERLRGGSRKAVVRVDAGVTLAMHWLIPRLGRFADDHPALDVQISTSDGPIDLAQPIDVYLRRDTRELRGLTAHAFLDEYSMLVASPALARDRLGRRDIARLPHIAARSRPDLWPQWCAHRGVAETHHRPALEFDNTVLAIQAASQGLGVMIVPTLFVGSLLENRLLVALEPERIRTGAYAYATRKQPASPRVAAFTHWLQQAGSGSI